MKYQAGRTSGPTLLVETSERMTVGLTCSKQNNDQVIGFPFVRAIESEKTHVLQDDSGNNPFSVSVVSSPTTVGSVRDEFGHVVADGVRNDLGTNACKQAKRKELTGKKGVRRIQRIK